MHNYHGFYPRIIGKYHSALEETEISLIIIPSYSGLFIFSVFLIGFPLVILNANNITINGVDNPGLPEKIKMIGVMILLALPMGYFFVIRPVNRYKCWIKKELKLTRI